MPVMSFAHLKPMRAEKQPPAPPATIQDHTSPVAPVRNTPTHPPGVMSFAHLRPGGKQVKQVMPAKVEAQVGANKEVANQSTKEPSLTPHRTTYRIPVILPTARLSSVNYCRGCSRFLPATSWEKTVGVPYGRCRRDDEGIDDGDTDGAESVVRRMVEVWKIIPAGATVARCWYWVKNVDNQ